MQAGGICPMSGRKELDRIQETARRSGLTPALERLLEGRDKFGPAGYGCVRTGRMGGARLLDRPLSAAVSFREEPCSWSARRSPADPPPRAHHPV
jgi:hypothetical protein